MSQAHKNAKPRRWLIVAVAVCCLAADKEQPVAPATEAGFELHLPSGFVGAPRMAEAATEHARKIARSANLHARAWEHKTLGCYAVLETVSAPKKTPIEKLHQAVRDALAADGVKVNDYSLSARESTTEAISHFSFGHGPLRGKSVIRSVAGTGTISLGFASCFYRPRRAARCAMLCDDILERFERL